MNDLAAIFAALGDPVRLNLLQLIAGADRRETCVCDLVVPLERTQPTVSHHCRVLSAAGLIVGEKRGRWIWYRLVPETLEVALAGLALLSGDRGAALADGTLSP